MTTKLIAHRGLTNGPDKEKENDPYQIDKAINAGFDCEIDLWRINDGDLYLGHDEPQYPVKFMWLNKLKSKLWVHAKNFDAISLLSVYEFNHFWHENDKYTMTGDGFIWTFPGNQLGSLSICVMPEEYMKDLTEVKKLECYGICSDHIETIKKILEDN